MIVQSEGYLSLIEYLSESIAVFESAISENHQPMTIKVFMRYQMVAQIALIFEQNKSLIEQEKMYVVSQFDLAFDDLCEVLGHNVENQVNDSQKAFITDFTGLLKNLFDSELKPA